MKNIKEAIEKYIINLTDIIDDCIYYPRSIIEDIVEEGWLPEGRHHRQLDPERHQVVWEKKENSSVTRLREMIREIEPEETIRETEEEEEETLAENEVQEELDKMWWDRVGSNRLDKEEIIKEKIEKIENLLKEIKELI